MVQIKGGLLAGLHFHCPVLLVQLAPILAQALRLALCVLLVRTSQALGPASASLAAWVQRALAELLCARSVWQAPTLLAQSMRFAQHVALASTTLALAQSPLRAVFLVRLAPTVLEQGLQCAFCVMQARTPLALA